MVAVMLDEALLRDELGRPQVIRCDNGPENISGTIQNWAKEWGIRLEYISSRANRSMTPMWSGSTARCAMNGYLSITGRIWRRFRCTPPSGCGNTITTAQIWPWAALPRSSVWPWLHNCSTSRSSAKRGDYQRKGVQPGRCGNS